MSRQQKTENIIKIARAILTEYNPMTVRQVYYQLVSRQVIKNNRSAYQGVSNALVAARQEGLIPWGWIEDRLRKPRVVGMWDDLADFSETAVRAYKRDIWTSQEKYFECWLEKDALSGIFEDVLQPYGVTLNVGRGYDGWDSIYNAARRYQAQEVTILYFGDLDPSGEDMVRSLGERLGFFRCYPEIVKCALNLEDVTRYNLPPDFTKASDTRQAAFVEKYGDISVELDALPAAVLRDRLETEIISRLDMAAFQEVQDLEKQDTARLIAMLKTKG